MHVIIMGAGRTGSFLACQVSQAGHEVTVIDWNPGAFSRLPDDFQGRTVLGNAIDVDVLRDADIEHADAFVAATSGDNRNIMAGQIARHMFRVPHVISRIKDPERAALYSGQGIDIDCRTLEGTRIILDLIDGME